MLSSISGQSEQWAQLTAYQLPPVASQVQGIGQTVGNGSGPASAVAAINPVAGTTTPALTEPHEFHADDDQRRDRIRQQS